MLAPATLWLADVSYSTQAVIPYVCWAASHMHPWMTPSPSSGSNTLRNCPPCLYSCFQLVLEAGLGHQPFSTSCKCLAHHICTPANHLGLLSSVFPLRKGCFSHHGKTPKTHSGPLQSPPLSRTFGLNGSERNGEGKKRKRRIYRSFNVLSESTNLPTIQVDLLFAFL